MNSLTAIPIKTKSMWQSGYDVVRKLPIRSIILSPSGSGKTVLLQNVLLELYKGCFERIYRFAPFIDVHSAWLPDIENI